MKPDIHAAIILSAIGIRIYGDELTNRGFSDDHAKACKHCGTMTHHKKGCCSADCFRAWKESQKAYHR